jgi:hypothetical protein
MVVIVCGWYDMLKRAWLLFLDALLAAHLVIKACALPD